MCQTLRFVLQRNLKDVAELYGCEKTLHGVEVHRRLAGLQSVSSTCFRAAGISAILIDDGLRLDKKHEIDWHKNFAPVVGRILRIEHLAEEILNEVSETPYASSFFFFLDECLMLSASFLILNVYLCLQFIRHFCCWVVIISIMDDIISYFD